jgi:hypothetical protein
MTERRRRRVELVLGAIWLIDGALQFQPYMFSNQFFAGVLGMANMGLPGILSRIDYNVSAMLAAHPVWWNAGFATLQVAIGAGLLWGRGRIVVLARTASILWGIGVWLVGEGAGALFMGGTSLVTGAPGAALIYSVVTVSIWPVPAGTAKARAVELSTRAGWALAWTGSALLELEGVNHAAGVPGAQIANGAAGEPWLFATLDRAVGHGLEGGGGLFAAVLGLAAVGVGLGALWRPTRAAALTAGIVIAAFVGVVGQNIGGVFTGQGTDPGTAPLLILMAVTLWPAPDRALVESPPDQLSPAPSPDAPPPRRHRSRRPAETASA